MRPSTDTMELVLWDSLGRCMEGGLGKEREVQGE